jgi:hypothetical protein
VKIQIIQIEPYDDTISVKDKMGWGQTGRVVLVWPTRGRLLDRRLDLVLILRHSQALSAQIALVTSDPEVRFQARSLEIPVYQSVRKAQKARWKRPRRSSFIIYQERQLWQDRLERVQEIIADPLHHKRGTRVLSQPLRIGLFALAVSAVLSIAAVLIPSAEISIVPEIRQQEITLNVRANDSVDKINLSGILPLRWASTIVEGRSSLQTTGNISIPTEYAFGEVVFQNLTDQPVVIPAGTVVSTTDSSHRFTTLRETRVHAGSGKVVETPIQAISPGSTNNLSAGRINAIEGELGVFLTVNNTKPTRGGSMSPSPAPSTRDRSQLREQLISTLTQNAQQEIQDSLEPEDISLTDSLVLVGVLSETYSPVDLQPASELELILRLEFQAPYIFADDSQALASAILDANLPIGYTPISDTMDIDQLTTPRINDGSTTPWRIRLSRSIQSEPSANQAVSLALGRSPQKASQLLMESLSLTTTPQIKTFPSWWPVMPLIPIRIEVITIGTIQASSSASSENVE